MKNKFLWLFMISMMHLSPIQAESKQEAVMPINTLEWQALDTKRVVFGHQSVGWDILNGLQRLADQRGVKINISEQRTAPTSAGISHFLIGQNKDPISKIKDFAAAIDAGAAQGADMALMKLCYIDFNADTDAEQIADAYIAGLDALAWNYPDTRFVAVTAPLTAAQTGSKAWIKRLMGKEPGGYQDNAKRAQFNRRIRERYAPTGRLFDLARIEAEANGETCQVDVDGQQVEALCPELTHDGGHLNERGQDMVATALLGFIGALPVGQAAK
ncbi:MAG: hypothetical protein ACNA7G_13385 [Methylobacter sp.]